MKHRIVVSLCISSPSVILLNCLHGELALSSTALDWNPSYLLDHLQYVKISQHLSGLFGCHSGVPQVQCYRTTAIRHLRVAIGNIIESFIVRH